MLIQLPSGEQINPMSVTAVRYWPAAPNSDDTERVTVEYGAGGVVVIPRGGPALRDAIAEQVNAACYELQRSRS